MAGFNGDALRNAILDFIYGSGSPATIYCALFTVAPVSSGLGTEVAGGSYARVAKTNNATNFPAAAAAIKKNGTLIDFGTASADWGVIVGAAWMDASSAGVLRNYGPFGTPVTVLSGGTFSIAANAMTATQT
jgi:hypothetical protein